MTAVCGRCRASHLAKLSSEGAGIGVAGAASNMNDRLFCVLEFDGGKIDPGFRDELSRRKPKEIPDATVQLKGRQSRHGCQLFDLYILVQIVVYELHHFGNFF